MLCEYSHTKSESLAEIRATIDEIQFFSTALFLLAHPVYWRTLKTCAFDVCERNVLYFTIQGQSVVQAPFDARERRYTPLITGK